MKLFTIDKSDIKIILIINFVIFEILSLIFNKNLIKINFLERRYLIDFSVVFFCFCFFIVDIVSSKFSFNEANKFFYYKLYAFIIFTIFCKLSIKLSPLNNEWLFKAIEDSPKMIINGLVASFFGYKVTNHLMQKINFTYFGRSIFCRYFLTTYPGEIIFSFIFSMLSYYNEYKISKIMSIFCGSLLLKGFLTLGFSAIMAFIFYFNLLINQKNKLNIAKTPI